MSKYNKALVAGSGFVAALSVHFFGLGSDVVFVVDAAVAAVTTWGVFKVTNTK